MQRKLRADVFANVSRGHLPLYGAAQCNVSKQLLIITAMGQTAIRTRLLVPKCTVNMIHAFNI